MAKKREKLLVVTTEKRARKIVAQKCRGLGKVKKVSSTSLVLVPRRIKARKIVAYLEVQILVISVTRIE